jgi:hypothetical protein
MIYKHLFRHWDDISFDSYLRCMDPQDFLLSCGLSEILELEGKSVHAHLAPKVQFLCKVLQGGEGELTWASNSEPSIYWDDNEEECNVVETNEAIHTMRVKEDVLRRKIPLSFWTVNLDRSLGPFHAYLVLHDLPHGNTLLQDDTLENLLACCSSPNAFAELCNQWSPIKKHSADSVLEFCNAFAPGLIPCSKSTQASLLAHSHCSPSRMIQLLLHHGANHKETDARGIHPLHWAAGCGHTEGVKALLRAHQQSNAILGFPDDVADVILEEQGSKDGATPIHWACYGSTPSRMGFGGTTIIQLLILQGPVA